MKEQGDILIVVLAGEPAADVAVMLEGAGVRWTVINGWSDGHGREYPWRVCLPGIRLISAEQPDLVAVRFGNELPSVVMCLSLKLSGLWKCKWVWFQDQQICDPVCLVGHVSRIRFLSLFFDHIATVYGGGRQSLLLRNVNPAKVSVVHNGSGEYRPEKSKGWFRKEFGVKNDSAIIVCTSWLIPRKRVDFLLRAFARIIRSCGNDFSKAPTLVIVGDGVERGSLEKIAVELNIDEKVFFLGARNDVRDILHESDVFALTSFAEACANAIIEAMSVALPVVITDVGAAREQVIDGVSGYVVDVNDEDGFAGRLCSLVYDAGLRKRMGTEAFKRWKENFTSLKSAQGHYDIWRKLIDRVG